jgi:hypothetical protein
MLSQRNLLTIESKERYAIYACLLNYPYRARAGGATVEKKDRKADEGTKQRYEQPVLVKHGKLKDLTAGKVGSAGGKIVTPLGCTRLFA